MLDRQTGEPTDHSESQSLFSGIIVKADFFHTQLINSNMAVATYVLWPLLFSGCFENQLKAKPLAVMSMSYSA